MLKLNKKVEYAILALLELDTLEPGEMLTAKEIVARSSIPNALAGKILQSLNKFGIVKSVQGINGGYKLSFSFEDIRLKELIEAVHGPIALVDCLGDGSHCVNKADCILQSPMERIQAGLMDYLMKITMADIKRMCSDEAELIKIETNMENIY